MTPEEIRQRAKEYFHNRFHWSQAVLAVGQEKMNIRNESLIKAMGGLGGGIVGDSRGICGALVGGVAFISNLYGRGNPEEKEQSRLWTLRQKLAEKFADLTREYGGIYCSNIARVNFSDREQVKAFREDPASRRRYCAKVVEETAVALGEILDQAERESQ